MLQVGEHLCGSSDAGVARAEPMCEACACRQVGWKSPLPLLFLVFTTFFVLNNHGENHEHLHTFASLSVSHYAQTLVFVPESPGGFSQEEDCYLQVSATTGLFFEWCWPFGQQRGKAEGEERIPVASE